MKRKQLYIELLRGAICVAFLFSFTVCHAQSWKSLFAYNSVHQIAMTPNKVFAVSDGSLYSVDKQTEKMTTYNRQSGLHGTNITCIGYDETSQTMLIAYEAGRLDLMTTDGVHYIGDLYDKDMMQEKTIYNISIYGHTVYFATHYGIQTFDMREKTFLDSYWLRPDGEVTPLNDVLISGDSIYAFSADSLYCAAMKDNLPDYRCWHREKRSNRIQPDPDKGKHYRDATDDWYAGGEEGIIRVTASERITYLPQGPLNNSPYRLTHAYGKLYSVPGSRWANQDSRPGMVNMYDGSDWTYIRNAAIKSNGGNGVYDFMNVAVDPDDHAHIFVTSYGTGLYEFKEGKLIKQYFPAEDNTLGAAAENIYRFTRLDFATYDKEKNLWLLVAGEVRYPLVCKKADGSWFGQEIIINSSNTPLHTPTGFVLDNQHPNWKWVATGRAGTSLILIDDNGTPFDSSDDKCIGRNEWVDEEGVSVMPDFIFVLMQDSKGRMWVGTDKGLVIIDPSTNYFESAACVRPKVMDGNGENPMTELQISALCEDDQGNIWVGTNSLGIYVLNSSATEILTHYTTENSAMPSNTILSLVRGDNGLMYIGTANGLVQFDPYSTPEGLRKNTDEDGLDVGSMMQWKLHFSYQNPTEIAASSSKMYALANSALYYVDRTDGQIEQMSKMTGLNGSSISHIAYDPVSEQLIIAYENGRIDLLDGNDNVRQMPDIQMKASSIPVTINSITTGSKFTYLAMPFGILQINPKKAEVSETYYIGENAGDVEVKFIVENGDSLYALSDGSLYSASLNDNLVDYAYWHKSALPEGKLNKAVSFRNELHILMGKTLYRYQAGVWKKVFGHALTWIHSADGQLLTYITDKGLFRITDKYQLEGLSSNYVANDAIYSQNEYWLAEEEKGLVRLDSKGDERYIPSCPNSNFGYFLRAAHNRMYATIGGRWASQFNRYARVNIYDGQEWTSIAPWDLRVYENNSWSWAIDPVSIAIDPENADHFYIATYGSGVFEYNNGALTHYTDGVNGSTLRVAVAGINIKYYTRADGAVYDDEGNLWVLNATEVGYPVHVVTPDHTWHALSLRTGGQNLQLTTPKGIWIDRRDSKRKWFLDQRLLPGVILLDDGGTPTRSYDDRCIKRSSFVDQNSNTLTPSFFYCIEQDHTNRLWIGTEKGIITIPSTVDFFTSNACRRIIIPRNDGTGLGDYLLGEEQINCMAVDGGNRMWIGTANSGLYLIEDDTITVAHFTEDNSLLPSNTITSVAIMPNTGEVFVGTDKGIASYRSDASEPQENMSNAYAYPNPVRPDYGGVISITGLMDNTTVNIVDEGGNLVCKTNSNGGTAIWNGRLPDGRRATAGVYTALCNASGGRTAVKILVIR